MIFAGVSYGDLSVLSDMHGGIESCTEWATGTFECTLVLDSTGAEPSAICSCHWYYWPDEMCAHPVLLILFYEFAFIIAAQSEQSHRSIL